MKTYRTPILSGLVLLAVSLIPASTFAESRGHHQSGVRGEVLLYDCAVVLPTSDCYDPYQASITVVTETGRFVARVTTDKSGHFEVFLKPGDYVLIGDSGDSLLFPDAKPVAVHVDKKQFTPVTIVYDSGIR